MTDVSKSPAKIAGMFDAIAHRYDFLNHVLSGGLDIYWRRRAIAALALTGRERLLDLCTGTGDVAIAAVAGRHRSRGAARVVGVDFAGAMLAIAREKVSRGAPAGRVALVRGDATRIPVADRSADAVTMAFGIRNVESPAAACAEMRRVLRPGGRLAILEFAVPDAPLFGPVYRWYLGSVLPRIGRAVSRHDAAYGYLPASIDAFPAPEEFVKILRQQGFADATAGRLTFGSVILYTAHRPFDP
ncbi:MAG TPA: bifunctional demethylmenaquinone methyltransferase/2-methoxy-6-polyprenyl-1,4-benzoquinol methylase UbiE [Vicinamibacterales bacterium]|nr:bifunctional demethylmenaquinone methyltransferase/2-methoxy-6-polyprenyl-1,4-benzoquinol methylase UbiE [Vicinamibacterales bacterium]